jgi:hypothetical protein
LFTKLLGKVSFLIFGILVASYTSGCSSKEPKYISYKQYKYTKPELYALYKEFLEWKSTPNVYGGDDKDGVDCSSLVQQVMYDVYGIMLPRTTYQQVKKGKKISKSELESGDLIFFKTSKKSNHVGIYLEKGTFLHSSTKYGVSIASIDNNYWKRHYWMSRRVK